MYANTQTSLTTHAGQRKSYTVLTSWSELNTLTYSQKCHKTCTHFLNVNFATIRWDTNSETLLSYPSASHNVNIRNSWSTYFLSPVIYLTMWHSSSANYKVQMCNNIWGNIKYTTAHLCKTTFLFSHFQHKLITVPKRGSVSSYIWAISHCNM
jgi:hypothetical protein